MDELAVAQMTAFCTAWAYLFNAGCSVKDFPGASDDIWRIQPTEFRRHEYPLVMRCY